MPANLLRKLAFATALVVVPAIPATMQAQFSLSVAVNVGPPPIPVYDQPPCPQPNYLWTPGFWAWGDAGYYWVPGTWVPAPQPGYLWTPGYWGYGSGGYFWHGGYWGQHVGYYGGINYGFGFGGVGFIGGAWRGGFFSYNTAVMHVNTAVIRNVYVDRTVINNTTIINNRASFNGPGGNTYRASPQEQQFSREQHIQPTSMQTQHVQVASQDRSNFASANHGIPAHAAVARPVSSPAELSRAAVPARGAAPANAGSRPGGQPVNAAARPGNGGQPANAQARGFNGGAQPANRPAPVERSAPAAQPAARPAPVTRSQPAAQPRPAQPARPAPETRPAPAARPAPEARPAPAEHAAPAARPAPASHPAPAAHEGGEHKH